MRISTAPRKRDGTVSFRSPCRTEKARDAFRVVVVLAASGAGGATLVGAADEREAVVTLAVATPSRPDRVAAGAPLRFALFSDGAFFVGGTSRYLSGRLA